MANGGKSAVDHEQSDKILYFLQYLLNGLARASGTGESAIVWEMSRELSFAYPGKRNYEATQRVP